MAAPQQNIAAIDRKIATSTTPGTAWTPPTISDLIQRIDAALRERSVA